MSIDIWMDKEDVVYIYTMEYYSTIKNEILPFADIGGPRDYYTKWSKSDKYKYYMISLICGI